MRNWPSKKFKYASPKNGCSVSGSIATPSFASNSPIEVGFEHEKRNNTIGISFVKCFIFYLFELFVSGERGIRTPDIQKIYRISSAAHSTRLCHLSKIMAKSYAFLRTLKKSCNIASVCFSITPPLTATLVLNRGSPHN